jgi:hypothetical protein
MQVRIKICWTAKYEEEEKEIKNGLTRNIDRHSIKSVY